MSWRILHISKPCRLSIKQKQLQYVSEENESLTIPLEDITVVILDSLQVALNSYVISAFAENDIVMFSCDERHTPNGAFFPFHDHSHYLEVAQLQIETTLPLKKRIWQQIIMRKILNQSAALAAFGKQNSEQLYAMSENVQSGDVGNFESIAAVIYWKSLFGAFNRNDDLNPRNMFLNYGYAILRGCLARFIVCAGLLPCFGVHHKNMLNQFNMADDLIEPFRPFIDYEVYKLQNETELTPAIKKQLISILEINCTFNNEKISILKACEQTVFSLTKTIRSKNIADLTLPYFN